MEGAKQGGKMDEGGAKGLKRYEKGSSRVQGRGQTGAHRLFLVVSFAFLKDRIELDKMLIHCK